MALLAPLESPSSFWRSEHRRQILQRRREKTVIFLHLTCRFYFGFIHYSTAALLCFEHIGHRRPSFLVSMWLEFWPIFHLHMKNLQWTLVEEAASRGSAAILMRESFFTSMFLKSSIILCSKLSKLVFVCLTTAMYLRIILNDDSVHCTDSGNFGR